MSEFDEGLQERNPVVSLLLILVVVFIGFVVIGPIVGFVLSYPLFPGTLLEYANAIQNIPEHPELKLPLYILQGCATLIGLIIAPILFLKIERKKFLDFSKHQSVGITPLLITVFLVIAFMAVDSVFIQWNASIHFPDFLKGFEEWAREKEDVAEKVTKMLTHFDSMGEVMLAILVIAVLPAIGEELVFRGMIQNEFYRGTKNIHLSIWISAILFSAIHMQFFGFVPRMLLGALFGYLYHWSGRLSISILAHFVNNAFSVLGIYFSQRGYIDEDVVESTEALPWPGVLFATVVTLFLLYYFRKYYEPKESLS